MRRYPEYKESGVEWIGEIPQDWKVLKVKHVGLSNPSKNNPKTACLKEKPVVFLPMERVHTDGTIDQELRLPYSQLKNGYTYFEEGDILIAKVTPCFENGKIVHVKNLATSVGFGSTEFIVIRPDLQRVFPPFLYYIFRSDPLRSIGKHFMTSAIGLKRVPTEFVENFRIPIPTYQEQAQIANFLERKTKQIDELIRIKERQIELLQEQRTALINQIVTKGLDPNVEMKPSRIEWIGEIPVHWETIPIKHTLQTAKDSIRAGPFGSSLKSHEFRDKGIRVYNQQSVYNEDFSKSDVFISEEKFNELRSFIVQPKDVLVTSRGTIGKMTIVPKNGEIGVLHPCLIRLRLNENKLIPKYLWWYVNHSSFFVESVKIASNSTTIEVIYTETLSSIKIPIPTVKEQLEIVEFLNVKIPMIDTTISDEQKKIELLKEYRQSLISEAVTGKIDIRNEV